MKPKNITTKVIVSPAEKNTSCMFSDALTNAENGNVLYITQSPINELPKDLQASKAPDKNTLRRITFTYPQTWEELVSKCSLIHTWKVIPRTIIVNNIDVYFDLDSESPVSRSALLCAGLQHAAGSCAILTSEPCSLIVSVDKAFYETHKEAVEFLFETYFYDNKIFNEN